MKVAGQLLLWLGLAVFIGAFFFDTTVETDAISGLSSTRVVNLARAQFQQLIALGGLAGFVGGLVLYGCGAVVRALAGEPPARSGAIDPPGA